MALLIGHDLIDRVNAVSTLVIALFTVAMFFVVKYQLRASKDIERAWLIPKVEKDPFNSLFISELTSHEKGKPILVRTAALLQLTFKNDGNGPVWVNKLQARMVLVDAVEKLPKKPELGKNDVQEWYPTPFVDSDNMRLNLIAEGSQVQKEYIVVYGKITYLDKFREERSSTFGYFIRSGSSSLERLQSHPEYNRNT